MAIEKLKTQLQAGFNSGRFYRVMVKLLKVSKIHTVEVDVGGTAKLIRSAVIQGIRDWHSINRKTVAEAAAYIKQYKSSFSIDEFEAAVIAVINSFNTTKRIFANTTGRYKMRRGTAMKGVVLDTGYGVAGKANFIIPLGSLHFPAIDYTTFLKYFRDNCYAFWVLRANVRPLVTGNLRMIGKKPSHASREQYGTKINRPYKFGAKGTKEFGVGVHEPVTVPMAWIELKGHEIQSAISASISEIDIVKNLIDAIEVDYDEHPDYIAETGALNLKRVVKLKVGVSNVDMRYDLKHIQNILDWLTDTQNQIMFFLCPSVDPDKAMEAIASPSFKEQAAAAAGYKIMRDLMTKNRHHVVKKVKLKKPNVKPRQAKLKRGKQPKKGKRFILTLPQRIKVERDVEKGQGKAASTDIAADLVRLRKYIQGRLPAEVRRNMGRPALRNITGRFSNSVQLMSLTQARATIMAKYTYLLSPYQTFENTGRRRWPMSYNPKTLIAKSIRNLALGRIEQKLTVRRV